MFSEFNPPEKVVYKTETIVEKVEKKVIKQEVELLQNLKKILKKGPGKWRKKPSKEIPASSSTIEQILGNQAMSNQTQDAFLSNQDKHLEIMEKVSSKFSDLISIIFKTQIYQAK